MLTVQLYTQFMTPEMWLPHHIYCGIFAVCFWSINSSIALVRFEKTRTEKNTIKSD